MSDLHYENLAKLTYKTYWEQLHLHLAADPPEMPTWEQLSHEERRGWLTTVQVLIGTVAAADLA